MGSVIEPSGACGSAAGGGAMSQTWSIRLWLPLQIEHSWRKRHLAPEQTKDSSEDEKQMAL